MLIIVRCEEELTSISTEYLNSRDRNQNFNFRGTEARTATGLGEYFVLLRIVKGHKLLLVTFVSGIFKVLYLFH